MRELKCEEINGIKYVSLDNRVYKFVEEVRGVREKFWLVQSQSKYTQEPLKARRILFKFNRNDVSCEDWGEIYASRIAKQIGVPCVEYHLASYEENGKIAKGVICGSYKKNENEIEATAYDVQTIQSDKVKNMNTVDDIMKNIMLIVPEGENRKFYYSSLRNALIKQCIFDFLLAQTDRHWFNTTFLLYVTDENVFNIRKAECYDNGCIAFLKRKYAAIEGITREIKSQGKNSQRLRDLLKDYVPMMGIKTSTTKLAEQSQRAEEDKLTGIKERRDDFLDELTDEILNNPEIARFFVDLHDSLDVRAVTQMLVREMEAPPQGVADMVELVVGYQFKLLNQLIDEKIQKINAVFVAEGRYE